MSGAVAANVAGAPLMSRSSEMRRAWRLCDPGKSAKLPQKVSNPVLYGDWESLARHRSLNYGASDESRGAYERGA
jgi:hypothetical protein